MKKKRLTFESETPTLDISSLVDVSFLLLVFFLVTSTIQRSEADLSTSLAGEGSRGAQAFSIDINLDKEGIIRVDGEIVDQPGAEVGAPMLIQRLEENVRLAKMTNSPQLAVIVADDVAPHQRLVDIMDALTATEVTTITLNGFRN